MARATAPQAPVAAATNSNRKPPVKQAELALKFAGIQEHKLAITLAFRIARVLMGHPPGVVRRALEMCDPNVTAAAAAAPVNDAAVVDA
jgi:hypothetical protein